MSAKIKTKADLIAFIQALPDDWVPTKCIQWHSPEVVAIVQGGPDEYEARQYVEIEIEGPRLSASISRGMPGWSRSGCQPAAHRGIGDEQSTH